MSRNERNAQKMITVTIDGQEIRTEYGKTILQVAREHGLYIPTMCYLSKVEPIGSCRMCVVEVEGVEGMILSCMEKAVDGAVIRTQSPELFRERRNIMKLYDVNHPLECGVCDKSGECDLQNKTLEFSVDSQDFAAKEQHRPVQNWGFISYDPALCIMCEKCVRVCTEIVGDDVLAISTGGYKSTIVNTRPDEACAECGECMAVCPVGALVSSDFKYRSNAWELEPIPSSCMHCSAGCQLYYEVKHESIENPEPRIYRVTNEFEFSSLCGAGRFAYDFENRGVRRDERAFARAVEALRNAGTIRFGPYTTNEEALLLQRLSERLGLKLLNESVRGYQRFMKAYEEASGRTLYSGSLEALSRSQAIVVLGTRLYDDAPMVKYHLAMAARREKAEVVYCHPMEDARMRQLVTRFVKYEAGSEEGVAALLAATLVDRRRAPEHLNRFLEELDVGYLSAESNVSEEELEEIARAFWKKRRFTLVAGADLYNHPRAEEIARLLAAVEAYSDFELLIVPPEGNAAGIARICTLSDEAEGSVLGYNAPGDFLLSALGDGDLDMPAMNQQEGTMTTVDQRVVPLHPALAYEGYELKHVAAAAGVEVGEIIDLTSRLPHNRGFEAIDFDELEEEFSPLGEDRRGYRLSERGTGEPRLHFTDPSELESYDGTVLYRCNEGNQFSPFTAKSSQLHADEAPLRGSAQFAAAAKISDGDRVRYRVDGREFERVFSIDTSLKGTFAIHPVYDIGLSGFAISSYRFTPVKIEKIGSAHE